MIASRGQEDATNPTVNNEASSQTNNQADKDKFQSGGDFVGFWSFFHAARLSEEDTQREVACIARIKQAVSQRCGIDHFIDYDETTVAFAGTKENMELMLEISTQKSGGKNYLYASLDDEVSWFEWDFGNINEFETNIIDHIANRVNRTIKTVTEVSKECFRMASYYLNDDGAWVCFEEDYSDKKWLCTIVSHLTESEETIKTYRLEN